MSINLQNTLRERKWFGYTLPRKQKFEKRIYADSYTISHMSQERELAGHSGCVNSLDWSLNGDKLLTGSDDTHLCVYDTYNDYKLSQIIHTGHSANIFSAKFMPQTSEKRIISCAGDSEIRIFDNGEPIQMYVCHHDQTKRICVYHDNPNEFLTCSQDGTVRHFDLRVPHICTPHSVKSFMTSELKPAKQTMTNESARKGCSQPIVDYSRYHVELNGMCINQRAPHYFAVAGMSNFIYLHDRRMMGGASPPATSSSSSKAIMEGTRCVKRFTSGIVDRWSSNHVTACQFAKSNSEELIGSWSSDAIYLFNINDEAPIDNTARRRPTLSASSQPKSNNSSASFTHEYKEIKRLIKEDKMPEAHEKLQPFLHQQLAAPIKIVIKSLSALFLLHSFHEKYREFVSNDHVDDTLLLQLDQYVSDAHDALTDAMVEQHKYPENWYCKWYLAVGYFLASGGPISFCHVVRKQFLQISLRYLQKVIAQQEGHGEMVVSFSSELRRVSLREGCWSEDGRITDEFINHYGQQQQDTNNVNNSSSDDDDDEMVTNETQWKWLDYLYIDADHDGDDDDIMTTEEGEEEEDDEDEDDNMISDTSTQSDQEDDISMYTEIFSSRGIRDIIEVSDSSDVESDFEAYRGYGISNRKIINEHVDVIKYRSKYKGHCNIETIKDVDFFGPNDEYIVSGSDGGDLFIWDKKSTRILQILQADSEIVNVAKGHPTLPILAVSGIDSTAKIFSPMTRPLTKSKLTEPNDSLSYSSSSRMFAQEEITQRNEENNENLEDHMNITRNMIAVLTHFQRTYRRRQQSDSDHSSEHSDEDEL